MKDEEIELVTGIYRAYDGPLGVSGVLLGTAVVTVENENRLRLVVDEMLRRGLIVVKHRAFAADHDDLFVLSEGE